jgi:amino acid permease
MNPKLAVVAMVNGMIGGVILVLPLLALEAGTLLTFFVIILTGAFSFYSCYLCVLHLGNHSDLDKAILHHFNQSKFMKIAYDFLVFINLLFLLVLYYDLIVQQWEGLLPYNIANPLCNAFALFCLVFVLNYFHFGAKLLGYGIISIVGYCIFLIWLLASAPSGDETIPIAGSGEVNMAASMGQAFAIQTFFIPVLKELPNPEKYARYTFIAYAIGCTVYIYIGYMGSFGKSLF